MPAALDDATAIDERIPGEIPSTKGDDRKRLKIRILSGEASLRNTSLISPLEAFGSNFQVIQKKRTLSAIMLKDILQASVFTSAAAALSQRPRRLSSSTLGNTWWVLLRMTKLSERELKHGYSGLRIYMAGAICLKPNT